MKKDEEIDTSSRPRVHDIFTPFDSKWTPKNGAITEKTWYLIWEAADRCLLKALPTVVRHFAASCFETLLKSISFQK